MRKEYSVAAILFLLFMVLISLVSMLNLLYFYISTFRSMCAVPNIAVFCSSLTSCSSLLFIAFGLSPGGSGYSTSKQNLKLFTTKFKS